MQFQVWYMKPDWFIEGNCARRQPDPTNLEKTHVHLKDVEIADGAVYHRNPMERVYHLMQGEVWSPNGEARGLIKAKGLQHTSMSVGDVLVDPAGKVFVVASFGFKEVGVELEDVL